MKKQKFIENLEQTWAAFNESFTSLSDGQMVQPGVCGEWSVKDILAHVSTWEEESLKYLPTILRGEQTPRYTKLYGGIDAFNARMSEECRGLSLDEVRKRLEHTHHRLMTYLESVPEEQFIKETRFRRRLGWDSYKHYPMHTQAIREWREHAA